MTTPDDRKTMQVSPAVHEAVYELATRLGTSANGAIAHLLDPCTIRVRTSEAQREMWATAAAKRGMSLPQWVRFQIETALQNPPEVHRETLGQIFYRVDMLCQAAGIKFERKES